jgi:hypothetical protein
LPTCARTSSRWSASWYCLSLADRSPERRTRGTELTSSGAKQLAAAAEHVQWFEGLLLAQAAPDHVNIILTWLRTCSEQLTGSAATGPERPVDVTG